MKSKQPIPYQYPEDVFLIRKIRENFDAASIDEHPHRHSFYEFLYIISGTGQHEVDGITYPLRENTIHIIAKGQVHQFLFAKNIDGYLIRFQDSILPAVHSQKEGYYYTILYQINQYQNLFVQPTDRTLVNQLLTRMLQEYEGQTTRTLDLSLIQHLLYPLLIIMNRYIMMHTERQDYQQDQYIKFTSLLEKYYKQHHQLDLYAQQIGLTKRQLSLICQEKSGKTAKQLINDRVLTEAKRFLKYTTLSLKEISDRLGYKNAAYLCRRFKKETGLTPTEFKRT